MKKSLLAAVSGILALVCLFSINGCTASGSADIPLPEHPRPDFERAAFINLNGAWSFTFDSLKADTGSFVNFDKTITVPFPWGSPLSGVEDEGDVAWYGREISVPASWKGKRVFLVVGASDYTTTAWVNGQELGSHDGGYVPFEFELTGVAQPGKKSTVILKADDRYEDWHLYGKQGYGNARGIWQTVYLEARGENYIKVLHFSPDVDASCVDVHVELAEAAGNGAELRLAALGGGFETVTVGVEGCSVDVKVPLPDQHLWDLDDPYLYEVKASLLSAGSAVDEVKSYFGQRKVGMAQVPGKDYKYVALNGKPLYMQLCLDQSYHPEGFYTFPSDEFMKNEILLSKKLGLNGNRIHIKVEIPRKLYWADKLGLLIMADVPNYWGQPCEKAAADWESCMRAQVERDFNHPSIFAWVDFNETWGLKSGPDKVYTKETQEWVRSMYKLTKQLDPTRLVEDNSPCNRDHVETDINSWHEYKAGHKWEETVAKYASETVPGGTFNYIGGNLIQDVPLINSECGNVWGYNKSSGDCDFSWDYHEMMNAFHRHLKNGGWLYTEHHDVVNEWNGYVRYDRSEKFDCMDEIVPGMTIADLHSPYYIVYEGPLCRELPHDSTMELQLYSSFVTDSAPEGLQLETRLVWTDALGVAHEEDSVVTAIGFTPYSLTPVATRKVCVGGNGVYALQMFVKDGEGKVLHRNFSLYVVKDAKPAECTLSFSPASYTAASFSNGTKQVLGGLKVNGFGSGYFEYELDFDGDPAGIKGAKLLFEAGAKTLFLKDVDESGRYEDVDYMRGAGKNNPCKSPNAYSMTDTEKWPSSVSVSVNGVEIGTAVLPDDPADHTGVLSWFAQPKERWMYEGGSHGYLISLDVPVEAVSKHMTIRFTVPEDTPGGLALYGREFGRYPLDPTLVFSCGD